jgi:hypothetical protein
MMGQGRYSSERTSILKTLLAGICLGIAVTRSVISISRTEKDLKLSSSIYDQAASDLPTVLDRTASYGGIAIDQKVKNEAVTNESIVAKKPKTTLIGDEITGNQTSTTQSTPFEGQRREPPGTNEIPHSPTKPMTSSATKSLPQIINSTLIPVIANSTKPSSIQATTDNKLQSITNGTIASTISGFNGTDSEKVRAQHHAVKMGKHDAFEAKNQSHAVPLVSSQNQPLWRSSAVENNSTEHTKGFKPIVEFERQQDVVIVTKLHGPHQLGLLEQSLCLLHYAYNNRVNYDIVVFTTIPINDTELVNIRQMVAPAKFTIVVDNRGLQNEIINLSPIRREKFLRRCNVTSPDEVTWWSECYENKKLGRGRKKLVRGRIAYNWQAEFRAWHIWKHPALAEYRWMLWLDTDGFSTRVWTRDPVAIAMQNKLVIFFGNFPKGHARGEDIQNKITRAFNRTLCNVNLENGHFKSKTGGDCPSANIRDIHGFFHITDLDFYRSDPVINWAKTLIGDCFLCRQFDDQIAVTVPPAMLAPERAWDMHANGVKLGVYHNFLIDGKKKQRVGGFMKYWPKNAKKEFPEAWGKCEITAGG